MDLRPPTEAEIQSLINIVNGKPNKPQLQAICVVNSLPKTGNKADLQQRIVQLIRESVRSRDDRQYQQVRQSVYSQIGVPPQASMAPPYYAARPAPTIAAVPASQHFPGSSSFGSPSYPQVNGQHPHSGAPPSHTRQVPTMALTPGFNFQGSPFYDMKRRLGEVRTCPEFPLHRNSVTFQFRSSDLQDCLADPALRVMVFCAAGNTGVQDISFPHQAELKVNGFDVQANLRGLKNKPGSTRPVDITESLRLKPSNYTNSVDLTYALTTKKYYVCLLVCRTKPVDVLVSQIQKKILKGSVIAELTKKAQDPDIEATSLILSLKCPLSYMRLKNPCRGVGCSHIQCFDATSYLQLQEQGPQWACPICNKTAPFDQLAIDEYVLEIIKGTTDSVDQVTIDPYGKWTIPGTTVASSRARSQSHAASFVDEDDLTISSVARSGRVSLETPTRTGAAPGAISLLSTPNTGTSRDSSVAGRAAKRPAAEVVDLTLDDDEDDGPPPVKRIDYGYRPTDSNGAPYQ